MANEALREQNLNHALETACSLFLQYGIEGVTKEMLARASGLSRSSLDRYFTDKVDCVLQTASWIGTNLFEQENLSNELLSDHMKTGIELLERYMELIKELYLDRPEYFVLSLEFRTYIYRHCDNYEEGYAKLHRALFEHTIVYKCYERGVQDGSMSPTLNSAEEARYFSEAYLGFLANLALGVHPSNQREKIDRYIKRVFNLYRTHQ